jgi:hypothetical protein
MKLKLTMTIAAMLAALLCGCASLLGPRDVELPLSKLQEALNRRFPLNSRYLELFDIYVSNPRLTLQPETGRITTMVDATIAPSFMKHTWKSSLALSGALAIDPARRAVILTEPRMENFAIEGMGSPTNRQIARIGSLLAEQMFKGLPLYTFGPDEFRYAGVSFIPTKITTKPTGLVVTFEPVK